MSEFSVPSLFTPPNDGLYVAAGHASLSFAITVEEDGYRDPGSSKDVARVAGPSTEKIDSKARGRPRRADLSRANRAHTSEAHAIPSSLDRIHHHPPPSIERLAFQMDLEDLKERMRMERQESRQTHLPTRTPKEILSTGHHHNHRHSHTSAHRTSGPYSTARTNSKSLRHSKRRARGIGKDSSSASDHMSESASNPLPAGCD